MVTVLAEPSFPSRDFQSLDLVNGCFARLSSTVTQRSLPLTAADVRVLLLSEVSCCDLDASALLQAAVIQAAGGAQV